MKQLMFSSKLSTSKQTNEYKEMFSENKTVAAHLKVKGTETSQKFCFLYENPNYKQY